MSINKYKPHLLILPEDDANRHLANGFILHPALNERVVQVMPPAGGWSEVLETFKKNHIELKRFPLRRIVLLIDFDSNYEERFAKIRGGIPSELESRVFVLGVLSEPEELRRATGKSFEKIGRALSHECSEDDYTLWRHDLLAHNELELKRMASHVKPFLFN